MEEDCDYTDDCVFPVNHLDPPELNDVNEPWPADIDPEKPF